MSKFANRVDFFFLKGESSMNANLDPLEQTHVMKELLRSEEKFRAIFEKAAIGIALGDLEGWLLETNPAFQSMLGYTGEELRGMRFADITHPEDITADVILHRALIAGKHDHFQIEKRYIRKDGQVIWAQLTVSLVRGLHGEPPLAMGMVEDITKRKQYKDQMEYLATHDYLTKIPNRYLLEENLKQTVAEAKNGRSSALLLIGVDNFKLANDVLGHMAGDNLLITIVSLLKQNLRQEDFMARFAGDEFAVLLHGVTAEEAKDFADDLRKAIEQQEMCIFSSKNCINLTVSIGVVVVDGTHDFDKLLSHAEVALQAAKESGKNKVRLVYPNEEYLSNISKTNEIITLIRAGLKENRFVLFFQPVFNIVNEEITHHEVLLRLRDQEGVLIPPGKFIPIAEHFGLMSQVDRWVVQNAVKALHKWPHIKLFVNLSGASLGDEELFEFIEKEIISCGVDPSRIGFEITETAAVKDFVQTERWIRRLKELGCSFALDDFGIGFSSFSYLRLLTVDSIKIDGSYVRQITEDPTSLALVQAIHTVAQALGKSTIAEFVESESTLEALRGLGINYVQGYYLGRPAPEPR